LVENESVLQDAVFFGKRNRAIRIIPIFVACGRKIDFVYIYS